MGQANGGKTKEKKSKASKSDDGKKKINKNSKPYKSLVLKNVLRPNGIFPPEILEFILVHVDQYDLIQATTACKLWKETSIQIFKRLYLQHYCSDPTSVAEDFDYVAAYIHHSTIRKNMSRGLYWAEDIALSYNCRGLLGGVNFTWTCEGNLVAINMDKTNHTSYGPNTMHTEAFLVDLDKRTRRPLGYGTHLYGGKMVTPMTSRYTTWEWDTCTVSTSKDPKKEIKIEREHKFVRQDTADPYHVLSSPQRLMDALPNLDGSPQIVIWDRSINSGKQDYMLEFYDLNTGKQLHKLPLLGYAEKIVGFYKSSIICKTPKNMSVVDMTNGNELITVPPFEVFHIHDNKIAIAEAVLGLKISFWDLESFEKCDEFEFKGAQDNSSNNDNNGTYKIGGLAFDHWKLVVNVTSEGQGLQTIIFDMTEKFKKLTSIYSHTERNYWAGVVLPPNGSILIRASSSLTVYDFNHPYLSLDIPIAFCSYKERQIKVKQYTVSPMEITAKSKALLKVDKIAELLAATYFYGVPLKPLTRVTCLSAMPNRNIDYYYDNVGRTGLLEQMREFRKVFGIGSVMALTSSDPNEVITERRFGGRAGAGDPCVIIFEKFDEDTEQWNICEPFWPNDIAALIEQIE